jgi:hypothetical protein
MRDYQTLHVDTIIKEKEHERLYNITHRHKKK